MVAWGHKPFENDNDIDWLDTLNAKMRITSRLSQSIRQKKNPYETRAAIEYLIRSRKAKLFNALEFRDLIPLAIEHAERIKAAFSKDKYFADWASQIEIKTNRKRVIETINEQLKYLKSEQKRLQKPKKRK